jgi:NAD(P)-dependent dehydrogenase (short-subunit alcohol dehydrogenase family)
VTDLTGSVAIVTGAAGGVGREVVRLLVAAGASVVAEDISPAVVELEEQGGGRTISVCGDAASADTARSAVRLAVDRFGKLDILVNNAARFLGKTVLETTDDEWDGLMATNVRSVFVHCRESLPRLLDGGGAIVNISSISGVVGLREQAAYCASKGAIVQLTRQLAVDYSAHGVRVNAVAPGSIDTPFLKAALSGAPDLDEALVQVAADHPLGRIADPAEIAEVVLFLASPQASYIAGAVVMADGGYTAR